jgi:hypothetical protein
LSGFKSVVEEYYEILAEIEALKKDNQKLG